MVKRISWWIFYISFLSIVLFLACLIVRGLGSGALGRISNGGQLIYLGGLTMAVVGLMAMCIAYVIRAMWHRLRGDRDAAHPGDRTSV
jgi:hypothetical protein